MTIKSLRNIDLNLLIVFQEIYRQGHLGKVGEKLNASQSAISHSLARLRDFYGDPLFIKTKSGMIPTAFAKKIDPIVNQALSTINETFELKSNILSSYSAPREFVLAMGGIFDSLVAKFHKEISEIAPNIKLKLVNGFALDNIECLRKGEIHLSIEWLPFEYSDFCCQNILKDKWCLIISDTHPLVEEKFSLEWFEKYKLLCIKPRNHKSAIIQKILKQFKLKDKDILNVNNIMSIPQIVVENHNIGIVSKLIAKNVKKYFPIKIIDLPNIFPMVNINMIWHQSLNNDTEHALMRKMIYDYSRNI